MNFHLAADPSNPRTPIKWGTIFALWSAFGIIQVLLATVFKGEIDSYFIRRTFVTFMPRLWLWAAMTPLIALLDARIRQQTSSIFIRTAAHLPLFIICALMQAVIRRSTSSLLMPSQVMVPFYVTVLYFADIEAVRYVGALIFGRVLDAVRDLAGRDRRDAVLRDEIARAQLHYLDLQLQPHFLFNALGSISELAHEAPATAARMVEHLSTLLSYATERGAGQEVTLRQELDALHPYLEIQRMRFPDWLSISERIEPGAADALVPRLLLQPLVENAIRHGLSQRQTGGRIEFGASVHGDDLVLSVYDNGAGLSQGKGGLGIGLANIRERLSTLYQDSQSLELLSHDAGGVEVLLRIPYRRAAISEASASAAASTALASTNAVPAVDIDDAKPYRNTATSPATMIGGWIFAGVFLTILSVVYVGLQHPLDGEPASEIIRRHIVHAGLWIGLTPIVIFFARRFPLTRDKLKTSLPLHVVAAMLVALAHLLGARLLAGGEQPPILSSMFLDSIYWNLVAYGILVGIAQRAQIEAWISERDAAAARLKAELTTARLSSVMLELRPDFLLSALATLRTLVGINPALAESLLTSFADFLRLTLESLGKPNITLERELALFSTYASLHRAGAGHYPDVQSDSTTGLEKILVPTGVLRMLADRLMESVGDQEKIIVSMKRTEQTLTIRLKPAESIASSSSGLRDPFGRLGKLSATGATVRFTEADSSLEVDLPIPCSPEPAPSRAPSLALGYG